MSTLRISEPVYKALRAHGEETYPNESCGVLLGLQIDGSWWVASAVPAGNARADAARTRYRIDPTELVKIEREAREKGMDIAGFYHSHPDHPAQWSTTDFAEAHWLGCMYVITAVAHGKATVTNAFRLTGSNEESKFFEQEAIRVGD